MGIYGLLPMCFLTEHALHAQHAEAWTSNKPGNELCITLLSAIVHHFTTLKSRAGPIYLQESQDILSKYDAVKR